VPGIVIPQPFELDDGSSWLLLGPLGDPLSVLHAIAVAASPAKNVFFKNDDFFIIFLLFKQFIQNIAKKLGFGKGKWLEMSFF
jgi:hypothetical protein